LVVLTPSVVGRRPRSAAKALAWPWNRAVGSRTSRMLRAWTNATAARASKPASRAETPVCTRWFTRSSTRASRSKRPWKRAIPIIPSRRTRPQGGARRTSGRHEGWTSYSYRQGPSPLGQRLRRACGIMVDGATRYRRRAVWQTTVRQDALLTQKGPARATPTNLRTETRDWLTQTRHLTDGEMARHLPK